jgi:hypothetical protein
MIRRMLRWSSMTRVVSVSWARPGSSALLMGEEAGKSGRLLIKDMIGTLVMMVSILDFSIFMKRPGRGNKFLLSQILLKFERYSRFIEGTGG